MAKRFFNTQRIEEDWYLNLSCIERELLRYCESKCDQAGVFNFNPKIASSYIGEKVTEKDISKLPIKKLDNGRYWIVDFISEQNGELSESCPAHKPIFKSIQENNLTTLLDTLSNTLFNRVQEKEIVIDKGIVKGKEKGIEGVQGEKSLHVRFREIFMDSYQRKKGSEFAWGAQAGKHGKHLNGIIDQAKVKVRAKVAEPSDDDLCEFWEVFLEHLPEWEFKNNFSPSGINSRFNEIFDKINNFKNGTNNSFIDASIAEMLKNGNPYARKAD